MSRDDVIRMAREVGLRPQESETECGCYGVAALSHFAKLVIAAEHERLIGNFKAPRPDKSSVFSFDKLIEFGAACALNEREACAKICDDLAKRHDLVANTQCSLGCDDCSDSIRARSSQP